MRKMLEVSESSCLFIQTFQGYKSEPELWEPIISGMVRQQKESMKKFHIII